MKSVLLAVLIALTIALPAEVLFWSFRGENKSIYESALDGTVQIVDESGGFGQGSAVKCDGKVMVLTAKHVIDGKDKYVIKHPTVSGFQVYFPSNVYIKPDVDLALIDGDFDLKPFKIADRDPDVGDQCYTVMHGFGDSRNVFSFFVSKTEGTLNLNGDAIPGFSGSGVIYKGKLTGVLTMKNRIMNLALCYNSAAVREFIHSAELARHQ